MARIFIATAARIFDVDVKEVTSQQRRDAKVVNFGILYGLGAQGLSRSTNMNVKEARAFLDKYFSIHAGVKNLLSRLKILLVRMDTPKHCLADAGISRRFKQNTQHYRRKPNVRRLICRCRDLMPILLNWR